VDPASTAKQGAEYIGDALDHATDLTTRFLSDRTSMSTSAAFLLNRVSREGAARLTSLAAQEGVSQPSMTQLIQRLERQGLVARLPDPADGRVAIVDLTDAGRDLLDERRKTRRDRLAAVLETLSTEDQLALWLSVQVALPILRRLIDNADAGPPEHP